MIEILLIFIAGIAGGFIAGFLGLGGGLAYILILPEVLKHYGVADSEMAQFVIANSLFGAMFASFSGNIAQIRNKVFYWKDVAWVGFGATISSLGFLYLVVYSSWYNQEKFSIVVVVILVYILIQTIRSDRKQYENKLLVERRTAGRLFVAGLLSGGVSSLSGLGGGVLINPAVRKICSTDIKVAKSISLGVIFITSFFLTIANMLKPVAESSVEGLRMGYIIFPIVLPLVAGTILASPLGVKLSLKASPKVLSATFAIFVVILIIKYGANLI
ncbi:hypothetical protein FUAX_31450 [Fulvitalea axinellae]|uniref:Probable membrane transporter protein n=1 Tax=Fulvitalea axinellae TaxID=1182444 RepID=A0AAU9CRI0_9BACT|nr:hypothetical protein FUAX_31450 [Fulvitalea axinellae]